MPQAKKDKSRKQKQLKYKNSKKMSKQTPEVPAIRQVPSWDSQELFTVTGEELNSLYQFFNVFAPCFTAVNTIYSRGLQEGKVKLLYEYEDGTPVPDEEIQVYTQKLTEYFQKKMAEQKEQAKETAKIVDINGAPVSSEVTTDDEPTTA